MPRTGFSLVKKVLRLSLGFSFTYTVRHFGRISLDFFVHIVEFFAIIVLKYSWIFFYVFIVWNPNKWIWIT